MPCAGVSFYAVLNVQVNVKYRSLIGAVKKAKSYKTTLSLHCIFISYNMKPFFLEFMYLVIEQEDSYTRQVCLGCKIWILNLELWGVKEEWLGLLYQNLVFLKIECSLFSVNQNLSNLPEILTDSSLFSVRLNLFWLKFGKDCSLLSIDRLELTKLICLEIRSKLQFVSISLTFNKNGNELDRLQFVFRLIDWTHLI